MLELLLFGSTLLSAFQGFQQVEMQRDALREQKQSQERAEKKQREADDLAETKRLEAIASNQSVTDYGNIWAKDNANKYADAAQKLSAGTGSFDTEDDDMNPFYTRGLL